MKIALRVVVFVMVLAVGSPWAGAVGIAGCPPPPPTGPMPGGGVQVLASLR